MPAYDAYRGNAIENALLHLCLNIMIILFLMALSVTWTVSSPNVHSIDHVMRQVLRQIMRCPEWPTDQEVEAPIAAFSAARYTQLVALVRNQSGEPSCGKRSRLPFNLNRPDTWNFCAMGVCSPADTCSCFKGFVGDKCAQFSGSCWLFYCRLKGCGKELPSLYCSCSPEQDGAFVSSGLYFYDEGLRHSYIPPPRGFFATDYINSHLIQHTGQQRYGIIEGNYYNDRITRKRKENSFSLLDDWPRRTPKNRYDDVNVQDPFNHLINPDAQDYRKDSYYITKPPWTNLRRNRVPHRIFHADKNYGSFRSSGSEFRKKGHTADEDFRGESDYRARHKNTDDWDLSDDNEADKNEDDDDGIDESSDYRLRREKIADEDDEDESSILVDDYAVRNKSGEVHYSKFLFSTLSITVAIFFLCCFL